jgi:hypothetical protein
MRLCGQEEEQRWSNQKMHAVAYMDVQIVI